MKSLALAIACLTFSSFIYGAAFKFKAFDSGARRGKRLIAVAGGCSTLLALYSVAMNQLPSISTGRVSLILFACSMALFWWTFFATHQQSLGFLGTSTAPSRLLRNGPYRICRHPFYLSYILGWLAACIYAPSIHTVLSLIVMATIYTASAVREEKLIQRSELGPEYENYSKQVGRFLPKMSAFRNL